MRAPLPALRSGLARWNARAASVMAPPRPSVISSSESGSTGGGAAAGPTAPRAGGPPLGPPPSPRPPPPPAPTAGGGGAPAGPAVTIGQRIGHDPTVGRELFHPGADIGGQVPDESQILGHQVEGEGHRNPVRMQERLPLVLDVWRGHRTR